MKRKKKQIRIIIWLPRILAVLYNIFLSAFALDVFTGPMWFVGLTVHLMPNFILAALTVVAWRDQKMGGWLFLTLSVVMAVFFNSVVLAFPVFLAGLLFLLSYRLNK